MDTQMMVLTASAGAVACIVSVLMALLAGMRYSDHLQRMPAATAFEDIVERLKNGREELEQVEAESEKQRGQRDALKAEFSVIIAQRDAAKAELDDLKNELIGLDGRKAEILKVRDELTELHTQKAELLRDIAEHQAECNQLFVAVETAKAQAILFQDQVNKLDAEIKEFKAEIENLAPAQNRLDEVRREVENANREMMTIQDKANQIIAKREKCLVDTRGLEDKKVQLEDELERLQIELNPLATEFEKIHQEIEIASQELKTTRKQQQDLEEELADRRFVRISLEATTATTRIELESMQTALADLKTKCEPLAEKIAKLEATRRQKREIEDEIINLIAVRANAETAISTNREEIEKVQAKLRELQKESEPLATELENVRREIITGRERQQELQNEVNGLCATRAVIEAEVAKARKNLGETQSGGNNPPADEKIANLLFPPACLVEQKDKQQIPVLPHAQRQVSEEEALRRVIEHMEKLGLYFPKRTLYAFHTALKTAAISPLTVLAGISGTGKSQLPRRYAEAMGIHFLKIPVQPRWDSPQDMLGFYNYLEGRYKATELARALVHFDPYHWQKRAEQYKDRLMLVLLDEMNLARVEYYFSEFLSQLEGRPEPGNINPDHIRNSTIILDIGSSESRRIYPGHNLLFVGTMNEDESTQTLSDKVLDRANLLRFSRPAKLMDKPLRDEAGCPATGYLSANVWHNWQRNTIDPGIGNSVGEWIKKLNDALDGLGRPFAHRVNQAILAYVANYPVFDNKKESAQFAFADLLAQRILPKLRGIELDNEILRPHLDRIKDLISNKLNDQQLADAFNKAVHDDGSGRPFVWTGVRRDQE